MTIHRQFHLIETNISWRKGNNIWWKLLMLQGVEKEAIRRREWKDVPFFCELKWKIFNQSKHNCLEGIKKKRERKKKEKNNAKNDLTFLEAGKKTLCLKKCLWVSFYISFIFSHLFSNIAYIYFMKILSLHSTKVILLTQYCQNFSYFLKLCCTLFKMHLNRIFEPFTSRKFENSAINSKFFTGGKINITKSRFTIRNRIT